MEGTTIAKITGTNNDRDFAFLREEGMSYIEAMARKLWTDYNTHDPGITILEVLAYAITDLGYRINAPIEDLISTPGNSNKTTLPTARNILTSKPISENDYRKLFIDIPGVKNAFIRRNTDHTIFSHCSLLSEVSEENPKGKLSYASDLTPDYELKDSFTLKGLNNILFELDSDLQQLDKTDPVRIAKTQEITDAITSLYHANRNLCEDLIAVTEVEEYEIQVCGDIEIDPGADAMAILVEILFRLHEHFAPSVKRYGLEELVDLGTPKENIFNGPKLDHGFITDEELTHANFKTEVRLSDIVQIISETPGVSRIRDLSMQSCPCNQDEETPADDCPPLENPWRICFPTGFDKVIRLCVENSIINIFKDVIPINIDRDALKLALVDKLIEYNRSLELTSEDLPTPTGTYRNSGQYFSFQNDLPEVYGIGEAGLSPEETVKRRSQALQLKGYLLFFDQILSTYFSHLENVSELLSADFSSGTTYYLDKLTTIADVDRLFSNPSKYQQDARKALSQLDDYVSRKGELLDHLLARFAENMNDYVFLMSDLFGLQSRRASLWLKAKLLEEYAQLSYDRGKAMNYYGSEHGVWDTANVSGLQHRIARLLGIRNYHRRDLTNSYGQVVEDSPGAWKWEISAADTSIIMRSVDTYPEKSLAYLALNSSIPLAWDPSNYNIRFDSGTGGWNIELRNISSEVIATDPASYTDENDAQDALDDYVDFIFNFVTDEGMFLIENILLRPDIDDANADDKFMPVCVDEDCEQCYPIDPYSFRVTIVLPGWTQRFANMHFRDFAENLIRKEIPAHILTRICWIGYAADAELEEGQENQMALLEGLYKNWLTDKMASPDDQSGNMHLKPLADLLHRLDTLYPVGILYDCTDDGAAENSIVLNRSAIGQLKSKEDGGE